MIRLMIQAFIGKQFISGMIVGSGLLGGGMLLGGLGQAEPASAGQKPVHDVIRARQIEIVDELGTAVLVIGSEAEGGAVTIHDRFGKAVVRASASRPGGSLLISSADGASTFSVTTREHESGGGAVVSTFNARNEVATRIFTDVAGNGVVETYRGQGVPLVSLGSTVGGHGQVVTYAGTDKPLVSLTASGEHEGQVYTYNAQGSTLIALGTRAEPAGSPSLRVFNRHGEAVITLEPDESDHGEIGLWRRDGTGRALGP